MPNPVTPDVGRWRLWRWHRPPVDPPLVFEAAETWERVEVLADGSALVSTGLTFIPNTLGLVTIEAERLRILLRQAGYDPQVVEQ